MEKINETEVVARLVELQQKPQSFSISKFVAENYDLLEKNKREKSITYREMAGVIGVSAGRLINEMARFRKKRSVHCQDNKLDTDLETLNIVTQRDIPRKIVGKSAKYFNN